MKKCDNCGIEISSRNAVETQFYEQAYAGDIEKAIEGEFPFTCPHCKSIMKIQFELVPHFYLFN